MLTFHIVICTLILAKGRICVEYQRPYEDLGSQENSPECCFGVSSGEILEDFSRVDSEGGTFPPEPIRDVLLAQVMPPHRSLNRSSTRRSTVLSSLITHSITTARYCPTW